MHLPKRAALAAACMTALALGGCATTGATTETPAQKLANACAIEGVAWDAFVTYSAVKPVKKSLAVTLTAADAEAKAYCANPPTDQTQALIFVAGAATQIGLAYAVSR